jgi:hypothetical protein
MKRDQSFIQRLLDIRKASVEESIHFFQTDKAQKLIAKLKEENAKRGTPIVNI